MDGKLVDWDAAQVHVLTHTLHYGLGAFEGIRAYELADGRSAVFRLRDHMRRLLDSCHIGQMECPYSIDDLSKAAKDTLAANGLRAGYIRPVASGGAELYIAYEAFFTGTAAEVTPIREGDSRKIGKGAPGPITTRLQEKFFEVVRGQNPKHASWLDVYAVGGSAKESKKPAKARA